YQHYSLSLHYARPISPTKINAGAVACVGTIEIIGENKLLNANNTATVTEVNPVRPPAPIPAADSTKVVVFDVPKIAPTDVAIARSEEHTSELQSRFDL